MTKKWLLALGVPALAAAVALLLPSREVAHAADHLDGPRAKGDPASDLTDVYSFMSPDTTNGVGHLVLMMNVQPFASATASFSNAVDYVFEVRQIAALSGALDPTVLDVTCNFDAATPQNGTCVTSGKNGTTALTKTVAVGAAGACAATDKICLFAGPRSDPFYFDLDGFNATTTSSPQMLKFTGTNKFAGANVQSIVVELDVPSAFGAGALLAKPILTVAAHTKRH